MSKKNEKRQKRRAEERAHGHDHHMYVTTVEVLCQNTGRTFRIETFETYVKKTCWCCNKENFEVLQGTGPGNVVVIYTDAVGTRRNLDKIIPDHRHNDQPVGLMGYELERGTFLLVDQHLP